MKFSRFARATEDFVRAEFGRARVTNPDSTRTESQIACRPRQDPDEIDF